VAADPGVGLVERYVEMVNGGELSGLGALFASDIVNHRPTGTEAGLGRHLLDVVGDGSAVRLHLDRGATPTPRPTEPVPLLQFGVHGFDPTAAAAPAAPGRAGGEVGANALHDPGVVRAGEGARGGRAAAVGLEGAGPARLRVRPVLDTAQGRASVRPAHVAQGLPCRATVVVRVRVVDEALPAEGAPDPAARERRDTGSDPFASSARSLACVPYFVSATTSVTVRPLLPTCPRMSRPRSCSSPTSQDVTSTAVLNRAAPPSTPTWTLSYRPGGTLSRATRAASGSVRLTRRSFKRPSGALAGSVGRSARG
jgi:hypothetical protein